MTYTWLLNFHLNLADHQKSYRSKLYLHTLILVILHIVKKKKKWTLSARASIAFKTTSWNLSSRFLGVTIFFLEGCRERRGYCDLYRSSGSPTVRQRSSRYSIPFESSPPKNRLYSPPTSRNFSEIWILSKYPRRRPSVPLIGTTSIYCTQKRSGRQ